MNQTYNNTKIEVQNGFKTFVLTLSISLIVFSVAYFMLSNESYDDLSALQQANEYLENTDQGDLLAYSEDEIITIESDPSYDGTKENIESLDGSDSKETQTVFGKLASTKIDVNSRAVLAGAEESEGNSTTLQTQTTTAPVPDAGVTEMTWGLVLSMIAFLLGFIVISKDPRNIALKSFEKDMMR